MKRCLLLAGLLLLLMSCAQAQEIRVNPTGEKGACTSITQALSIAQDGDIILLSGGTYDNSIETYPLIVRQQVEIRAEEGAEVLIDVPAFSTGFQIEADHVTLRGVNLHFCKWGILCTGDDFCASGNRIVFADPAYRVSSCGLWLCGCKRAVIENNAFVECGLALAGPPISEERKDIPSFTALFEVGDNPEFFSTHTISGNTVNSRPMYYFAGEEQVVAPQDAGEFIAVDCGLVQVSGLEINGCSMGIVTAHCDRVEISDTQVDTCGIFGVYLAYVQSGLLERISVQNTNHGLDFRVVKNISVSDCQADKCEQGIFFSFADDCITRDCCARDCGRGFFFACGNDNQVVSCTALGNENGFSPQKENHILLLNNLCQGNTVAGLRLERTSAVCFGNRFEQEWVGVLAYNYGDQAISLYSNVFEGCQSCAMYLRSLKGGCISGNQFADSAKTTIELAGTMENVRFTGNLLDEGGIINRTNMEDSLIQ